MSKLRRSLLQAAAGAGGVDTGDDDFANVVLLLDGDGTSGDDNNTFTDSSTNGFTVTESGSVVQGSFSPYGDNWSNYFDGSNDYFNVDLGSTLLGQNDFTIEGWVNLDDANNAHRGIFDLGSGYLNSAITGPALAWFSTKWRIYYANGSWRDSATFSLESGKWYHFAYVRDYSASSIKLYINGVSVISQADSTSYTNRYFSIGGYYNTSYLWKGNISNFRITESVVYTTSFTPPSAPLSAITGTTLLTAGANRFFDQSATNTVAVVGTPKVTPFSPFKNDDARDITTDGGSGYFDGSSYLSVPDSTDFDFGTGDFTWEAWIRTTVNVNYQGIVGSYLSNSATWGVHTNSSGTITYFVAGTTVFSGSTTVTDGAWHHIAIARSGTSLRLFVDGVQDGSTQTNSTSIVNSTEVRIGSLSSGLPRYFTGDISNVRIIKGTAVYTSAFTPPTAPLTAITNTSLLLNFQDAGIYDRSGINNLDTVGDARLGFAPIYGTGSLAFDGTGDYLEPIATSSELALGTGDFTIEFWMNPSSVSSTSVAVLSNRYDGASDNVFQIGFDDGSSRGIHLHTQVTAGINTGVSATLNTWQHIAFVRSNGTLTCYKDGTSIGTPTTFTKDLSYAVAPLIGKDGERSPSGTSANFNGYLDDLRVTKGVARYTSAFTPPDEIDLSTDTHREYVTLFLDGDGTANGQNNTFTDSSTNGATVTENGSVVQGVFSPYGDNWSNYFNDDGYLQVTKSTDLDLDTNNWTIECWLNLKSASAVEVVLNFGYETVTTRGYLIYLNSGALHFAYSTNGSNNTDTSMGSHGIVVNEWTHLAVVRNGSTITGYINGSALGTTINIGSSDIYYPTSGNFRIGSDATNHLAGYVSNMRLVNGTAVYTSNFTPSTSPLTAITNTKLLTCQSNRFLDNSSSSHTITVGTGTPQVTRFSPFESNKPYDITTYGGSGYFDTSSAYLQIPTGYLPGVTTGDFTIEGWWYFNDFAIHTNYFQRLWSFGTGLGDDVTLNVFTDGDLCFRLNDSVQLQTSVSGGLLKLKEWYHIALVRSSGTVNIYVNGTSVVSGSFTANINTKVADPLYIGSEAGGGGGYFSGYCSDVRTLDSALYTSSFTPPTAPLTAVTNTELLLNFQDSAIPDLSGLNNIDTVGNAKVGASDPTKYGSNAMQFDGSGDYLTIPSTQDVALGSGDFTIECWANFSVVGAGNGQGLFQISNGYLNSQDGRGPAIGISNSNGQWFIYYGAGTNLNTALGSSPSANTWYHVAFVRTSGVIKIFIDGTQIGSNISYSGNYTDTYLTIGGWYSTSYLFDGYIDDLRVTKGVARYTSNFTPPTEALPKF